MAGAEGCVCVFWWPVGQKISWENFEKRNIKILLVGCGREQGSRRDRYATAPDLLKWLRSGFPEKGDPATEVGRKEGAGRLVDKRRWSSLFSVEVICRAFSCRFSCRGPGSKEKSRDPSELSRLLVPKKNAKIEKFPGVGRRLLNLLRFFSPSAGSWLVKP